jgi:hypothetical protein
MMPHREVAMALGPVGSSSRGHEGEEEGEEDEEELRQISVVWGFSKSC